MDSVSLSEQVQTAMVLFLSIAGPPLLAALVIGLIVGLLQAMTQIQDQTMPLTFKVLAVLASLVLLSGAIFPPLLSYTERLIDDIPALTRG